MRRDLHSTVAREAETRLISGGASFSDNPIQKQQSRAGLPGYRLLFNLIGTTEFRGPVRCHRENLSPSFNLRIFNGPNPKSPLRTLHHQGKVLEFMNNHRAGDKVKVTVYRGKQKMDLDVTLGEAREQV